MKQKLFTAFLVGTQHEKPLVLTPLKLFDTNNHNKNLFLLL